MHKSRRWSAILPVSTIALSSLWLNASVHADAPADSSTTSTTATAATNSAVSGDNNSTTYKAAKFASGTGNLVFLGGSVVLPLLDDHHEGRNHALRTADSLLTSTVITEALKHIVREKRPDSQERTSFPSGHATAAFAAASMAAHWHRSQAPFWYLGATLIAASRVKLHRHFVHDVIAGALVGYGTTRLELSHRRGLLLSPFISRDESREDRSHSAQFQFGGTF